MGDGTTLAGIDAVVGRLWPGDEALQVLVADDIGVVDWSPRVWDAAERAWVPGSYETVAELRKEVAQSPSDSWWEARLLPAIDAARRPAAAAAARAAAEPRYDELELDGVPPADLPYARAMAAAQFEAKSQATGLVGELWSWLVGGRR